MLAVKGFCFFHPSITLNSKSHQVSLIKPYNINVISLSRKQVAESQPNGWWNGFIWVTDPALLSGGCWQMWRLHLVWAFFTQCSPSGENLNVQQTKLLRKITQPLKCPEWDLTKGAKSFFEAGLKRKNNKSRCFYFAVSRWFGFPPWAHSLLWKKPLNLSALSCFSC